VIESNKISVVETKGLPSNVKSYFISAKIPIIRYETLLLTELHNENYWYNVNAYETEIVFLDHRHWLYDDDIFLEYVTQISKVPFKSISVFESPFGYESQNSYLHDEKVYSRTKILVDKVKSKQDTLIISPSIREISVKTEKKYLDYFIKYRSLFDIYSVQMCTCTTDQSIGAVCGFTKQVLDILPKPVWVTKWAVPSCEIPITSSKLLYPSSWKPISHSLAAIRMKFMFDSFNDIYKDIKWCYVLSKDLYKDNQFPPDNYMDDLVYRVDHKMEEWGPEHFIGIVDYNGNIKFPIVEVLCKL
jgi:hypothetical protein